MQIPAGYLFGCEESRGRYPRGWETTVRNLFSLFFTCILGSKQLSTSSVYIFKYHTSEDKYPPSKIITFTDFSVANKDSSFVGNPVLLVNE